MTFSRRAATGALALIATAAFAAGALIWVVPALAAQTAAVSIVDKTFDPSSITVKAGDTVTWTITKAIPEPHSVTSGTGPSDPNSGKLFDSGITLKDNGQTFSYTFTQPGTYQYYCQVHPTVMTGTITVEGPGGSGLPSASPAASVASAAPPPSGAPAASGSPAPSPSVIPGEEHAAIPDSNRVAAAVVLVIAIVLLFASAGLWRRVNKA